VAVRKWRLDELTNAELSALVRWALGGRKISSAPDALVELTRRADEAERLWEAVGCAEAHFDAATDEEETAACQMFYSIVWQLRAFERGGDA
jgi:hypothetical protein